MVATSNPQLIGMTPGLDYNGQPASNVSTATDLYLLFNAPVSGSSGNVELHRASDHQIVDTFPATSLAFTTVSGANATYGLVDVPLHQDPLDPGTSYYVTIESDAFLGKGGPYEGISDPGSFTFTTAPVQPTLTGLASPKAYTVGNAPTPLAPAAIFTDADFTSGTITVSGLLPEDIVSLPNGSFGGLAFSNGAISKGGQQIGSYQQNTGTFTANLTSGSAADVQTIVQNLGYSDASGSPTASRNVTIAVSDEFGRATYDPSRLAFTDMTANATPTGALNFPFGPPSSIALADLNGDGRTDILSGSNFQLFALAAINGSSQYSALQVSDNSGTASSPSFGTVSSGVTADSTYNLTSNFALADLSQDGLQDIISQTYNNGPPGYEFYQNTTLPNNGGTTSTPNFSDQGLLTFEDASGSKAAAPSTNSFALGDVNGDGAADFVGLTSSGNGDTGLAPQLQLYVGSAGTTTFEAAATDPFAAIDQELASNDPNASNDTIALGDMNGDGKLDLVVGETNGSIVTFLNTGVVNGLPTFSSTPTTLLAATDPTAVGLAPTVAVADLNNDGLTDIVYREAGGPIFTAAAIGGPGAGPALGSPGTYHYLQNTTPLGQSVEVDVTAAPPPTNPPPTNPPSTGSTPPSTGSTPQAPTNAGVGPSSTGSVSFDPGVTYDGFGVFTLTGQVSSSAGVSSVEITADVDGTPTDLGPATVNADGTFTFYDAVGPATQGFITATETDAIGNQFAGTANYDLEAGLKGFPFKAQQDSYDPTTGNFTGQTFFQKNGDVFLQTQFFYNDDGSFSVLTANGNYFNNQPYFAIYDDYNANGQPVEEDVYYKEPQTSSGAVVTVQGLVPGQTLHSIKDDLFYSVGGHNTFVFTPGFGNDVITSFKLSGQNHDTIDLARVPNGNPNATDAQRLAGILNHATTDQFGNAVLHLDAKDSITIQGVSVADLKQHRNDFSFHGGAGGGLSA
ncbi:MAG TPA: VCBS repeat-containing protein [Lichenihabitans sp.]|nr:VCBS repeat-containing protein [Lichenihabitans sp.]